MDDRNALSLHLAFFVPTLAGGGAERVVVTLANAFAEAGYEVDLLLTSRCGPYSESVSPQVSVVNFGCEHTWRTVPALVQTLRQRQPDVLVSALFGATVAAYGATAWMKTRGESTPCLCVTVHAPLARPRTQGIRARLQVSAAHMVLRSAETVVTVSQSLSRNLARHTGRDREQINVIHNPINIDAVQSGAQAPPPHSWFQDDVPVIVSAGRLHAQKDHRTLLRALARLHEQNRRARVIILGKGPERKCLDEQSQRLEIASDTAFPGFVKNPYPFMAQADVFALPSVSESFGNVVVEALACGTPVVATESGGPAEILHADHETYGSLVPPQDPAALADALTATLNRPVDQVRLQRRARDFGVSRAVGRYHALFEQIARGAS